LLNAAQCMLFAAGCLAGCLAGLLAGARWR